MGNSVGRGKKVITEMVVGMLRRGRTLNQSTHKGASRGIQIVWGIKKKRTHKSKACREGGVGKIDNLKKSPGG